MNAGEQLIKGEYYTITDPDYDYETGSIIYLHEKMSDEDRGNGFYLSDLGSEARWDFVKSTPWLTGRNIRLASYEEKEWLKECIRQNKYVLFSEIKINKIYECWS